MGGQMQQSNVAAALYDHPATTAATSNGSDARDAVLARWLQSTGFQHLDSPHASTGVDTRLLPNLFMQVICIIELCVMQNSLIYICCIDPFIKGPFFTIINPAWLINNRRTQIHIKLNLPTKKDEYLNLKVERYNLRCSRILKIVLQR